MFETEKGIEKEKNEIMKKIESEENLIQILLDIIQKRVQEISTNVIEIEKELNEEITQEKKLEIEGLKEKLLKEKESCLKKVLVLTNLNHESVYFKKEIEEMIQTFEKKYYEEKRSLKNEIDVLNSEIKKLSFGNEKKFQQWTEQEKQKFQERYDAEVTKIRRENLEWKTKIENDYLDKFDKEISTFERFYMVRDEMFEKKDNFKDDLIKALKKEIEEMRTETQELKNTIHELQMKMIPMEEQAKKDELTKKELEMINQNFKIEKDFLEIQLDDQKATNQEYLKQIKSYKEVENKFDEKIISLSQENQNLNFNCTKIMKDFEELKDLHLKEIEKIKSEYLEKEKIIKEELEKEKMKMKKELDEGNHNLHILLEKRREQEKIRKQLHNQLMELKGNIRVMCRVRPKIKGEDQESSNHLTYPFESDTDIELNDSNKIHKFSFNRVFNDNEDQQCVFDEISQFVQSAIDGYKVCIFAYGQTGSGKTYTMTGNEQNKGIIYLSIQKLFETFKSLSEVGWKFKVNGMMMEIYNDSINDLLNPDSDLKYDIKEKENFTEVTNMTEIQADSVEELMKYLDLAAKNRSKGYTKCNEKSSRSHSIFNLKISGENEKLSQKTFGVLNFVDLAGSERLKESEATGKRLEETKYINKSLSSLGDVISALSSKEKFIPYRNSKLTFLLKNYLGKDSKTLMFVNLSPLSKNLNESLCSLRFASKVNSCELGQAKRINQI